MKKVVSILLLCFILSGCSLYWLRGEPHTCRGCGIYYYGVNCPKCNEDYYINGPNGEEVDMIRDGNAIIIDGKVVGYYDEVLPDGSNKWK